MFFNSSLAKRLLKAMFVALTVPGLLIAVEVKPLQDKAPMILPRVDEVCALTKEGDLYCWGHSSFRINKDGKKKTLRNWEPTYVGKTKDGKKVKFVYMNRGLYFLTAEGELYTYEGMRKGDSEKFVKRLTPSPTEGHIKFVRVKNACGLTKEGKAYCWGWYMNLGSSLKNVYAGYPNIKVSRSGVYTEGYENESTTRPYGTLVEYIPYPTLVEAASFQEVTNVRFTDITIYYNRTYAKSVDGSFYYWGQTYPPGRSAYYWTKAIKTSNLPDEVTAYFNRLRYSDEMLGRAVVTDSGEEVWFEKVSTDKDFLEDVKDDDTACGLTKEGKAYCWNLSDDYNDKEKKLGRLLGYGGLEGKNRPVAVAPSEAGEELRFNQTYRANRLTCGATLDGRFYCWGDFRYISGIFGEDFKREPITYKDRYGRTETSTNIQLVPKEIKIRK